MPDWHCMEEIRHQFERQGLSLLFKQTPGRRWIASAWGRWSAYSGDVAPPFRLIAEGATPREAALRLLMAIDDRGKAPGFPLA